MKRALHGRWKVYNTNLNANVLRMPYKDENHRSRWMSMYFLLPESNSTSIGELLDKLTIETLDDILIDLNATMPYKVNVYLPKFTIEKQFGLTPALKRMGVPSLFDENVNFSDFFAHKKQMYKTKMEHMAKIEVDELGAKAAAAAAAATIYGFHVKLDLYRDEFNCNHPFVFIIHDDKIKEILFAGIYHGPTELK